MDGVAEAGIALVKYEQGTAGWTARRPMVGALLPLFCGTGVTKLDALTALVRAERRELTSREVADRLVALAGSPPGRLIPVDQQLELIGQRSGCDECTVYDAVSLAVEYHRTTWQDFAEAAAAAHWPDHEEVCDG